MLRVLSNELDQSKCPRQEKSRRERMNRELVRGTPLADLSPVDRDGSPAGQLQAADSNGLPTENALSNDGEDTSKK